MAGIALVGGFVFLSASSPSYACSTEFPAAAPIPSRLGAVQDDMGRKHIAVGELVRYTYCPPASGSHVNLTGQGPIPARFYGPNDAVVPQGWIHNLEHGALVLLYRCDGGGCDATSQAALRQLFDGFPPSPVCDIPRGTASVRSSPASTRCRRRSRRSSGVASSTSTRSTPTAILRFYAEEGERTQPRAAVRRAEPVAEPALAEPAASPAPSPS